MLTSFPKIPWKLVNFDDGDDILPSNHYKKNKRFCQITNFNKINWSFVVLTISTYRLSVWSEIKQAPTTFWRRILKHWLMKSIKTCQRRRFLEFQGKYGSDNKKGSSETRGVNSRYKSVVEFWRHILELHGGTLQLLSIFWTNSIFNWTLTLKMIEGCSKP